MKIKKIIFVLLLLFFCVNNAFSFVVTDLVLTALEEAQHYADKLQNDLQWINTLKDYKDKYEQICKYYEQLKGLNIESFQDVVNLLENVRGIEKNITGAINTAYNDYNAKRNYIYNFGKDMEKAVVNSKNNMITSAVALKQKFNEDYSLYEDEIATTERLEKERQLEINQKKDEIKIYKSAIETLNKELEDYDKVLDEYYNTYKKIEDTIDDLNKKYKETSLSENDTETQIQQKKELRDTLREEINKMYKQKDNYLNKISFVRKQYQAYLKDEIIFYEAKIENIQNELKNSYGVVLESE